MVLRRSFVSLVGILVSSCAYAQDPLAGFDEFANQLLKDWKVPGVAVAVVKDDKVILLKGYGVRDVAKQLPVTPKTLFAIGSVSKSFTVTGLGTLADRGKFDWDRPVREYLPDFRMYDEVTTERMTGRDMVTHRSGLPRHDLVWYSSTASRQQIYERLRHLPPSKEFRSTWQYQNLMYMTAGVLAARLADMPWEEHIRRDVFAPLGMTASNFSVSDSQKAADHALPYRLIKDEITEVPFRNIDAIGPAGSINSNVEDMVKYLRMHLNAGNFEGKQILSASASAQMQTPQMVMPGALRWEELGHTAYGMALMVGSYRGYKYVQHGGNIDGFSASLAFLPQKKLGVVVLTNLNGNSVPALIGYQVFDRLLGMAPVDWSARLKSDQKAQKGSEEEATARKLTVRKAGTSPTHDLRDYEGEYEHPGYGIARITQDAGKLKFAFSGLAGPLDHFHYDVFEIAEDAKNPLQRAKVRFAMSLAGDIESLSIPIESTLDDIQFRKLPDRAMTSREFLEPFTGSYSLGPQSVTVQLKGKGLTLVLPGQPEYELAPVSGTRFTVRGMNGYSAEFKAGEMIFYQPNGTFVAKKR